MGWHMTRMKAATRAFHLSLLAGALSCSGEGGAGSVAAPAVNASSGNANAIATTNSVSTSTREPQKATGGTSARTSSTQARTAGGATALPANGGQSGAENAQTSISDDVARTTCLAYIRAQCGRLDECAQASGSILASCVEYEGLCPAMFLSNASNYSVDSLRACALEWRDYSCDELTRGNRPACVAPGPVALGGGCRFHSECASGLCSTPNPAACGICLAKVGSGEACTTGDQCPAHHLCSFGRCWQLQSWAPEDSLQNGEACNYDGRCEGACAPTSEGDRCVNAPGPGEACLTDLPVPGAFRCRWRLICGNDGVCVSPRDAGSACADAPVPCYASYCDSATGLAPGTCEDWRSPGAICDPSVPQICGENDRCTCDDTSCSTAHCIRYGYVGWPCDEYNRCRAPAQCIGGFCEDDGKAFQPPDCPVP